MSESLQSTSGKYFEKCAIKNVSAQAKDQNLAEQLWDISLFLTGLKNRCHLNLNKYVHEDYRVQCYQDVKNPYVKNEVKPLEAPLNLKIDERFIV